LEGGTLPNHYRTLGIPRGGTAEQLKKRLRASHRRLAFAYHPDRFPNEDEASRRRAQAMIRQIEEAYAVLSDEQQRRAYEYDSKGRNRLPNDSRLYPSSAWYNDPQLTKWLAAPKPTGAKPRGELAGRPADGSSGSAAPTAGLEEKPQAPAAGLARIESLVSEQGGVGRMAPSQLTDVSRRLRELASSPGVDVAMQAQQTRMGYTAELRPPALKAVESSGGTWARPDSSAPPVFVFEGSQAVWAPFVAQAGAPVGVIVDTIYEAEGLKGMLQEIGIPEKQFAVVALDVAGDRDQALQEIQQHFHLPGFPAPQPVTFPAGDSADAIEQALRGYGFSFTNSPTPQLHQVDLYLSSEA
jgi:curved DNA-binding protein CbpA